MNYYDAIVRLSGLLTNEVQKYNLSAAEVVLLNAIHGEGSVMRLSHVNTLADFGPAKQRAERKRLEAMYAGSPRNRDIFDRTFGAAAVPLPETVDAADLLSVVDEEPDFDPTPLVERKAPETPDDPVLALKESIRELGGKVPRGVSDVTELRGILKTLQPAATGIPDATNEPEPATVL